MRLTLLILCAGLLSGCGSELERKKKELTGLKQQQSELYQKISALETEIGNLEAGEQTSRLVTPLVLQSLKHYIFIPAKVEIDNNLLVTFEPGGKVSKIHFREGDQVRKGQVVVEMDASLLQQSVKDLKSALDMATAAFDKQKKLWAQGIGSEMQLNVAQTSKDNLAKKLQELERQLSQTKITAPIDGTLDELKAREGETITPGAGVFRLVNRSGLKVTARVADTCLAWVRQGDEVMIKAPSLNAELKGRITFISQTLDPTDRTYRVSIIPQDNGQQLRPELPIELALNDQTRSNVIVIDERLVQLTEEGKALWIAVQEGNRRIAKKQPVKTGMAYGGQVEIISGLREGDLLIGGNTADLSEGEEVK